MTFSKKGFSVIELIIVVAFLGLLGSSAVFFLRNQFLGTLESDSQSIKARLQEAQIRAIAGLEGQQWGIHFDNAAAQPFYALFPGASYSAASSTYFLSQIVEFLNPSSGTSTDIIFQKLSGNATSSANRSFGGPFSGLVGYWKFDDGSGITALDSSGVGNTGTVVNGPVWTAGKSAGALDFDGVDDYVSVANSTTLNINGNVLTISAWIKPDVVGGSTNATFVRKANITDKFILRNDALANGVTFVIDTGTNSFVTNVGTLQTGIWQLVTAIYDGSNMRVHINASQVGSPTAKTGTLVSDTDPLYIGANGGTLQFFNGIIDEVRIYNRALSDSEVKQLYEDTGILIRLKNDPAKIKAINVSPKGRISVE
ncbi:MAG: hypothetical protein HYW34_03330 [Candidatus Brennerbacteria bacterium]|nr:hypothetical protein [Candidatus Brennerbacteria bacterium]